MKIIEMIADAGHRDTLASIEKQHEIQDIWFRVPNEDGIMSSRMLVPPTSRQSVRLSTIISTR